MQREVINWYRQHQRELPWREPGFPAWGTLISEFMLQQTPVSRVAPIIGEWLERWPTPAAMAASPSGEVVRAWGKLGYPRRALWLHSCAVAITERFGGEVPSDVDDLLSLPGIGPYTSRAVAVFAFGAHEPMVDTNIRRVIARHNEGHADQGPPSTKRDLEAMRAVLPSAKDSPEFNIGLMELGSLICTAKNPKCTECPIASSCAWAIAGYPESDRPGKPKQKKYEGSDRQARGAVLAVLRASEHPVSTADIDQAWPDAAQRGRAIDSLLRDGLIELVADDKYQLPA